MSTATQQTTYTTGLSVTAVILNNEFNEIYTNINKIYDFVDDSSGSAVLTVATATPSVTLNSDLAIQEDGNGNYIWYIGGVSGTVQEVWVPTTGDLSAAVTSISTGGGTIRILPGTHTITSTLTLANGIKIVGGGMVNTVVQSSGVTGNLINVQASGVTLRDFTVDMNSESDVGIATNANGDLFTFEYIRIINPGTGGSLDDCMNIGSTTVSRNGTINGCEFIGSSTATEGLKINEGDRVRITNCYEQNNNTNSIRFTANSKDCTLASCVVDQAISDAGTNNKIDTDSVRVV